MDQPRSLVNKKYCTDILKKLVRINSVNPSLVPGAPGEAEISECIAEAMQQIGLTTTMSEVIENRPNVIGIHKGARNGPALLLNGHTDTVGIEGMKIEPLEPVLKDGLIYGRGSHDMKGGIASILGATKAVIDSGQELGGDLIVAAVCDEEYASIGTEALVKHIRADAAIVTESTELQILVAHKGFAWIDVETLGLAAHGSQWEVGVDAITMMGRVLGSVEKLQKDLSSKRHALVGKPSVHASLIKGGKELSTYPDYCKLQIERRMIPGETRSDVDEEMTEMMKSLSNEDPKFKARKNMFFVRDPMEVSPEERLCQVLSKCTAEVTGTQPLFIGGGGWLDTQIMTSRGIPSVAFGPTGGGAHATTEYIQLDSVYNVARVLEATIPIFCETKDHP